MEKNTAIVDLNRYVDLVNAEKELIQLKKDRDEQFKKVANDFLQTNNLLIEYAGTLGGSYADTVDFCKRKGFDITFEPVPGSVHKYMRINK